MRARLVLGVAVVLALGCASKKYAPVSGKVTVNGKPLAKAEVSFQPIAAEGSVDAGVGSNGMISVDNQLFSVTNAYRGELVDVFVDGVLRCTQLNPISGQRYDCFILGLQVGPGVHIASIIATGCGAACALSARREQE